jgi:hypothetical protein
MDKLDQIKQIKSGHPQELWFQAYAEAGISAADIWAATNDAEESLAYNNYASGDTV